MIKNALQMTFIDHVVSLQGCRLDGALLQNRRRNKGITNAEGCFEA